MQGWKRKRRQVLVFLDKKRKYMIVKTGREEEEINETLKAGRIERTDKCKYLGMAISTDGQLT